MEIRGKCIAVLPLESGVSKTGKEWEKLSFIIEYGDEYKKQVHLTLFNKTSMSPAVGDQLTCQCSPESREYNGKYYTNINVWKIEGFTGNMRRSATGPAQQAQQSTTIPDSSFETLHKSGPSANDTDDLPF